MSMLKFNSRKLSLAILIPTLFAVFYALADDIPNLDTVTVVGKREDGVSITCTGVACFDNAQEEAARSLQEWLQMYNSMPQEDLPLNGQRFCQALGAEGPQGCSLSQPPASPGIAVPGQATWQPNGCGTGGIGTWFQDAILEVISSNSYSDNIHAPYPGVSFRAACDEHDRCWAAGGARHICDGAFHGSTTSACGVVSDPGGRNTCNGFANGYHFAVSTTNGSHSAYAGSSGRRTCALWARDMRENDCDD